MASNRQPAAVDRYDVSAEQNLIGAVLQDPARLSEVRQSLDPTDFSEENRPIYAAMLRLDDGGNSVALDAVSEVLRESRPMAPRGQTWIDWLAMLSVDAESIAFVADDIERISTASAYRRAAKGCAEFLKIGHRVSFVDSAARAKPLTKLRGVLAESCDRVEGIDRQGERPRLLKLEEVQPKPIQWLWKDLIPRGKLVTLAGNPGVGKGLLWVDMAKRVTTGLPFPGAEKAAVEPGGVLILSAEDAADDTIVPRLDWAGADRSKIRLLSGVLRREKGKETERALALDRDIAQVEAALDEMKEVRPLLAIIDPVTAYLGRVDSYKDAEVRGILAPLKTLAEKYGVTILIVLHLNKRRDADSAYRIMGSMAFTAQSRVALLAGRDEEDPGRRVLYPVKANLSTDVGGWVYRIADPDGKEAPRVEWESEPIASPPKGWLGGSAGGGGQDRRERDGAIEFLRELLADGPVDSKEVFEAATANGISRATLRRAQKELGIKPRKEGMASGWFWALPEAETVPAEDAQPTNEDAPSGIGEHLQGEVSTFGQEESPEAARDPEDAHPATDKAHGDKGEHLREDVSTFGRNGSPEGAGEVPEDARPPKMLTSTHIGEVGAFAGEDDDSSGEEVAEWPLEP